MMPVLAAIHGGGFGVVLFLAFFLLLVLTMTRPIVRELERPSRQRRARLVARIEREQGFVDGEDE